MLTNDKKKKIKVFILNYTDQWRQFVSAILYLDIIDDSCALRLVLKQPLSQMQLSQLPQTSLFNPIDCTINIEMDRLKKVQRMDELIIALQFEYWPRALSLSFTDELYCDMIFEQLELNLPTENKLPCREDQMIEYIAQQIEGNPIFVEMFFNCEQVIEAFMRQAKKYESQPDSPHKRAVFKAIKQLFLRADKKIIKLLIKGHRFKELLLCLSYNYEFGDRPIDYHQQYRKSLSISNLLQIQQNSVLEKYAQNIKIRFLIHVATSMFIQPLVESVLHQILNENSLILLQFLVKNPEYLANANRLVQDNPHSYLLVFSQLWEMFKSIMQDARSIPLKRAFKDIFITQNMLNFAFQAVLTVTKSDQTNNRIYQQFLEALNPCLSHKWNQSQQLLLFLYQQRKIHILQLLLNILKVADYNTKVIVLQFAKNLVQITENRQKMKQSFFNYFFNQFVSLCTPYFQTTEQIQTLVDFFMKLYKMDLIRTRRAIIESNLLKHLQTKMHNKYVLILVLKLLRFFIEFTDDGIFIYMKRHELFLGLRQLYFQIKKYHPNGIVKALFVGLLKDLVKTENSAGIKYLHDVMCPQDKK